MEDKNNSKRLDRGQSSAVISRQSNLAQFNLEGCQTKFFKTNNQNNFYNQYKPTTMKSLKSISLLSLLFCFSLFMLSCGGNSSEASSDQNQEAAKTEVQHGEGKEYTSAYVCPMHCEGSGSEEAGKCPVCGMDYVAQADHAGDGHKH